VAALEQHKRVSAGSTRQRNGVAALTAALAVILGGCSSGRSPSANAPEVVKDLRVATAQQTAVPDWVEAVGTVRATQTAEIASQIAGNVVEVRVHEGDRVRASQVLAVIDDASPRAAVDQAIAAQESTEQALGAAETEYALAASTLERYQQLYEKKEISGQQIDQMRARARAAAAQRDLATAEVSRAKAGLAEAQVSLGHARVEAPFAGLVAQRQVDPGTFASVGTPLLTLEDISRYRLEALLNETDMHSIRIGSEATAVIDALGTAELSGRVAQIVPSADAASRSFLVKIDLPPDTRLRSGLFGRARFSPGTRTALTIPTSAVVERGQMQAVFVLDASDIATLRYVTTGKGLGQRIEILSGLETGERVVAAPNERELAGKHIEAGP
jgi:RND family efflux transporter MFP subunit